MMRLTFRQKLWIIKTALKLYVRYAAPLRKRMSWIYRKVEEWSRVWKDSQYQPVSEEKAQRWLRLGKAFGLSQSDVELKRMAEDTWTLHNLRKAARRTPGKAR